MDGGRRGEVAHGWRARGEMCGGAPEVAHGGAGKGGWPMEGARGGRLGGLGGWGEAWGGGMEGGQNLSDLAGDKGGGMGGGVGRWPMEGGQAGEMAGGHQKAMWEFLFLGSLENLTTALIWLVTRVGGWGEAWGGGPWRAGKGGDGGPESSVAA